MTELPSPQPLPPDSPLPGLAPDPPVVPADPGCPDCGMPGANLPGPWSAPAPLIPPPPLNPPPPNPLTPTGCGCGAVGCVPGRRPCYPCCSPTWLGRAYCALYECVCCEDPCYEPAWVPAANAAFFVDQARPQTQMGLRWDNGHGLYFPDRAEYFWARADGTGPGPKPVPSHLGELRINMYNDISLYAEGAHGRSALFIRVPYRNIIPQFDPTAANFANMSVGTKSLLTDCELLQITFEFTTYIPIGNTRKGIGNGIFSLEPTLLWAIKMAPDTYIQGQLSEWIPINGDSDYKGSILHYHLSLNHVLLRILPDVPLIGTAEVGAWGFQHGHYTDPNLGAFQKGDGYTFINAGGGVRLVVCSRIDWGVGAAVGITHPGFPDQLVRTEFRWRF
jgi:hypothetical protein